MPLKDFQKDVDDCWVEWCDSKIVFWRRVSLRVSTSHGLLECERQIEHFKMLRRRR